MDSTVKLFTSGNFLLQMLTYTSRFLSNPEPATPPAEEPLAIGKSAGCRLLGELIRSYAWVPRLVAEYAIEQNMQPYNYVVEAGTTFLTFVLDHLVPSSQTLGDRDTPAYGRLLICAIAAATHTPEAQGMPSAVHEYVFFIALCDICVGRG